MIQLKTPSRNKIALSNIEDFEDRVTTLLQLPLLNKSDPDIIQLLNKVNKMLEHINKLKSQLVF